MDFKGRNLKKGTILGILLSLLVSASNAACPYASSMDTSSTNTTANSPKSSPAPKPPSLRGLNTAPDGGMIPAGGYSAVISDLKTLLTTSDDFWPADFGNYGPLMIRLAWHCAGSYRISDGRGGCDGGRIRYNPEISWPDNANLDKALELLKPIKAKYGDTLSWGDLIILVGNTAIESMGGPIIGFCGGRVDDVDGTDSIKLGPTEEQEAIMPCEVQGQCEAPLGQTTMGLIYVNPEGPMGEPDPERSATDIRNSFGNMGFDDRKTVAIVGGGHAFGKCHGPCANPPCGDGKGENTFTSGFEGQWTTVPTTWTNQYFTNLLGFDWRKDIGPGGHYQWSPKALDGSTAVPDIMMLTADLALTKDPSYLALVEEYANDLSSLEHDFSHAWYELTTRDMGPVTRCIGDMVPEAQPFQYPLPEVTTKSTDYVSVRRSIQSTLDGNPDLHIAFSDLAWQCASTFRKSDYRGGCNGARIRFSPEIEWDVNVNAGVADTIQSLSAIYDRHDISWADLIVLAGQVALEDAGSDSLPFCGGRVDAEDGSGSEHLEPRVYEPATVSVRDDMEVKGLTPEEYIAIMGGKLSSDFQTVSNDFFRNLMTPFGSLIMNEEQVAFAKEDDFKAVVEAYAEDEELFKANFAKAWVKMMNADRFDGPTGNLCDGIDTPTL